MNKTLYVRDEDIPIWDQAQVAAAEAGISLSQLIALSLRPGKDSPDATAALSDNVTDMAQNMLNLQDQIGRIFEVLGSLQDHVHRLTEIVEERTRPLAALPPRPFPFRDNQRC